MSLPNLFPDVESASQLFLRIGFLVLLLSFGVLLVVLFMRFSQGRQERRRNLLVLRWRPVLSESALGHPVILPEFHRQDMPALLALWNHDVEAAQGKMQGGMALLARAAGLDKAALQLLERGWVRERLLAIVTLGNLREPAALETLLRTVRADNPFLSLAAGRAAVQIDPAVAMPVLAPLIAARTDWPEDRVAGLLREAGPQAVAEPLTAVMATASPEQALRLIHYLEFSDPATALAALRRILRESVDPEWIAASLQVIAHLGERGDLEAVRGFLAHPGWVVRLQAVNALGSLGEAEDEERLVGMLRDPQWWVRYRAAQAVTGLKSMEIGRLRKLQEAEKDPFARDILRQAASEQGMTL